MVTSLTDKVPNLDQSIEYDLVTPLSTDLDLFSVDHKQHSLIIKNRIDYEYLCLKKKHCIISVSIAVSNEDTIDVYILPIRILNINDNIIKFHVNRTVIEIEENDENWSKKSYPLPKAYDDDGDLITYSIYLQNWNTPDGLFDFDEINLLLKPLKKFDREEQNIYLLRLIAHNQNDASTDIIVLIKDLNDNPPKCQQNHTIFLITNISIPSIYSLNVTDIDEGDNAKLEYRLVNPLSGFSIDRYNGQIKFDYKKWINSNQSVLIINVTDHGKPLRLSTQCFIEIKFTSLFSIDFKSNNSVINQTNISIEIENLNNPLGYFLLYDKQENKLCTNCLIHINSSIKDFFYLNYLTYDLYLNLNSIVLMKMLTNYYINKENISLTIQIDITDSKNPSIKSTKNYSVELYFNKINILIHSNIFFLKIHENILLNDKIPIFNRYHHCLNNQSNELILSDSTHTFEIERNFHLVLKKYLNVKQQKIYHLTLQQKENNSTKNVNVCSVQLYIYVLNPYSIVNIYPYFSQSFYVLSSKNLSQFSLPLLPSYVKYISSVPNLISVNPYNGSIVIRSSSLYSFYNYDFQIEAIDSHVPSLSSSISIRIIFGINKHSPRLIINSTKQSIEVLSSKFLYQIKAYDPDILLNDQTNLFPPTIEYEIEPSINIEIERFTGRIFLKDFNKTNINFTLIMTDFGQPNRLTTRHILTFDIQSDENMSISFLIIILSTFLIIILLSFLLILINCCLKRHKNSLKTQEKTTWKNISPTAPNSCLIDNEYITTQTSLPRVSSREQRIYPTFSRTHSDNNSQHNHHRRTSSHLSLDKVNLPYSSDKQDYQQHVSMTDINKYLERFEKIYNDSSSQQYLHQPIGSVV
ncbi:unnamed protein product [Adineta steineri]|uniref:Cadherin domain-containing protein n=1 Tax=Adineta steineri TaxID=433720 RepID=A0A814ZX47_9BILA|nr:unnamed protein product [Adineta steineri]CAF1247438.1 unnamed protein product [Adineta steineri]